MLASILLSGLAVAGDWASEPQPLVFADTYTVFDSVAFDTGYWPDINDPISVRFHVTPTGGVVTSMEADSLLEWPEPLNHQVAGVPGTGWFGVDATIDVEAEVHIDILGLYTGSVPLWAESVVLDDGVAFDGLLLPGGPTESVEVILDQQGLVAPLEYAVQVIPGLDLVLSVDLYPELVASLTGLEVVTEVGDEELVQVYDGQWSPFPASPDQPGELGMVSTWWGDLVSVLSLVIEPEVSLDTFLGSFSLAKFPIDVPLIDRSDLRDFAPVYYVHPLPALALPEAFHDFGDVPVGTLANLEVPLTNIGALDLEGEAYIEGGDGAFTVFPEFFQARDGATDGVVVTFAPDKPFPQQASLVIRSNDPAVPEMVIELVGNGWEEEEPPADDVGQPSVNAEEIRGGCGCASGVGPAWLALFPVLLLTRRRARAARA